MKKDSEPTYYTDGPFTFVMCNKTLRRPVGIYNDLCRIIENNALDDNNENVAVITKISDDYCIVNGTLTIPETVQTNNINYDVIGIGKDALKEFKKVEDITCINLGNLVRIQPETFNELKNVTSVILNSCTNILAARIICNKDNIKVLRTSKKCRDLQSIGGVLCSSDGSILILCPRGKIGDYTIPEKVTSVYDMAFSGCKKINSIIFDTKLRKLGSYAFAGCENLKYVNINKGIVSIGNYAFKGCDNLQDICFPDTVVTFGESIFSDCRNITLESLPKNINYVPSGMFSNCSSIKHVQLPSYIKQIKKNAFAGCENISTATLNHVELIDSYAFSGCANLIKIEFSNNINYIGSAAFSGCKKLDNVIIPEAITKMSDGCFSGCSSLSSLIIPNSITRISNRFLSNCTSLKSVTIPNSVKSIGESAFRDCKALETVRLSNNLKIIESDAFRDCTALYAIDFPESLEEIGEYAFAGTDNLESLIFRVNFKKIGVGFSFCKNLKTVKFYTNEVPAVIPEKNQLFLFSPKTEVHVLRRVDYSTSNYWKHCNLVYDLEPVKPTNIQITLKSSEFKLDEEINPSITFTPSFVLCKEVKWTSSDESKLVYLGLGQFYAVGKGEVNIIAETIDGSELKTSSTIIIK